MNINSITSAPGYSANPAATEPPSKDSDGDSDHSASQASATSKPRNTPAATVQISNTAQKMLQEATETPTQTQQEANSGDIQAKKLLAKEAEQQAQQGN